MGQGTSSRRSTASFSRRLRPKSRKNAAGRCELSDAFNLLGDDFTVTLMNVNAATEEELMTLPGVTRAVARAVVEHRQRIGHFKKVEDLALVSGVGANKLAAFRAEICVGSRGLSRSSSCGTTPSEDSAAEPLDVRLNPAPPPLDVNAATMFELMAVRNIDQLLAANIVHHREKRGPFRSLDDMLKVRGLDHRLLGELKRHLAVEPSGRRHRRSSSVPPAAVLAAAQPPPADLDRAAYEALAGRSLRPPPPERFAFRRSRRAALRLATWNLERLTPDKAANLGVVETVCLTVLENGISLIALQELGDSQVLEKICKELNNPTLKKVQDWVGLKGLWMCHVSDRVNRNGEVEERLGFLYDTRRGIAMVGSETLTFPQPNNNGPMYPCAFYATFRAADSIQFSLLNVHLPLPRKADIPEEPRPLNGPAGSPLATVVGAWLEKVKDTALHLVIGDFNCDPAAKDVRVLQDRFTHLVRSGETTNACPEDAKECPCYDNVWMSPGVKKFYTGKHSVVREGLCHLAIPKGWSWGGLASGHCPVWAEFYVPTLSSLSALTDAIEQEAEEEPPLPNGDSADRKLAEADSAETSSHDCSASNASENSC